MSRLMFLPLMLALLGGAAFAGEGETPQAPELQRFAEMVADRVAQHVKRYEEARQGIRRQLIDALGKRDVVTVKKLKATLAKVEERRDVAQHVARAVEEAKELLASGHDVRKLEKAQKILAEAVKALGGHKQETRRPVRRVTKAKRLARVPDPAEKRIREARMREMAERVLHEAEKLEVHQEIRELRREVHGLKKEVAELKEALK